MNKYKFFFSATLIIFFSLSCVNISTGDVKVENEPPKVCKHSPKEIIVGDFGMEPYYCWRHVVIDRPNTDKDCPQHWVVFGQDANCMLCKRYFVKLARGE